MFDKKRISSSFTEKVGGNRVKYTSRDSKPEAYTG